MDSRAVTGQQHMIDATIAESSADPPGLVAGIGAQPVIDDKRHHATAALARPFVDERAKSHAIGPARHTDGDGRSRLEGPERSHQILKFFSAERRRSFSRNQRVGFRKPPFA